ncbi:hypothetical protein [Aquabacterium sp.]|uniref:hypothetical protein n=1 Tax=Aquabacterium sp. TaxID=1872578 RepID=UPI003D6D6045
MRAVIFLILAATALAAQAAQPDCIPSTWALSTTPVGKPIERHTDRPSLFVSSNHGLAAYWFCQDKDARITYWEVHGTPKAILDAGGARVLEMLYIKDRDASLNKLSATPCNRPDIADADERQLCRELLEEIRAQWPKAGQ